MLLAEVGKKGIDVVCVVWATIAGTLRAGLCLLGFSVSLALYYEIMSKIMIRLLTSEELGFTRDAAERVAGPRFMMGKSSDSCTKVREMSPISVE